MSRPRNFPFNIGPVETTSVGRSTLAAPINWPGVVLSQPPSSTTASMGLPRMDSSTSMASKFRNSMAVGRIWVHPATWPEIPRAGRRPPRRRASRARQHRASRNCRREFRPGIANTDDGRPSKASTANPGFSSNSGDETVFIFWAVTLGAAERFLFLDCHGATSLIRFLYDQ